MSELPPEIITTILARLPVKSLLRFRCVSKPWRSLIDGQDFTKLHLHQSAETNTNRTLIMKSAHRLIPDVLDSLEQLDIGNNRFPNFLLVNGSCNGLVLLSTAITSDKLFLWNPSTRKVNVLLLHALPPLEAGFWTRRCGLGYDSKHDDYKVVCMDQDVYNRSNDGRLFSETTIYSLKTNSWKKAAVDFPYDKRHCRSWDIYVNDALHCVVDSSFFCAEEMIMAFDLAKEEYNVVPKPESAAGRVGLCLASVGGRLVVVVDQREFWVMKEYGVKGSWCKLANCFDDPGEGCVSLRSLAFSESWIEGLFNKNEGTRLDWYRLGKNKTVTVAYVEGSSSLLDVDVVLGSSFGARVCVASLVSPFSPSI